MAVVATAAAAMVVVGTAAAPATMAVVATAAAAMVAATAAVAPEAWVARAGPVALQEARALRVMAVAAAWAVASGVARDTVGATRATVWETRVPAIKVTTRVLATLAAVAVMAAAAPGARAGVARAEAAVPAEAGAPAALAVAPARVGLAALEAQVGPVVVAPVGGVDRVAREAQLAAQEAQVARVAVVAKAVGPQAAPGARVEAARVEAARVEAADPAAAEAPVGLAAQEAQVARVAVVAKAVGPQAAPGARAGSPWPAAVLAASIIGIRGTRGMSPAIVESPLVAIENFAERMTGA